MKKGVTLLELMIVVVVIGILATLGIANYGFFREKAIVKEGGANLQLIMSAARIVRMEQSNFALALCATPAACNTALRLNLSPANWTYSVIVDPASATEIRAIAVRTTAWGGGTCTLWFDSRAASAFSAAPTFAPGAVCAQ